MIQIEATHKKKPTVLRNFVKGITPTQLVVSALVMVGIAFTLFVFFARPADELVFVVALWVWLVALFVAFRLSQAFTFLYLLVFGLFLLSRQPIDILRNSRLDDYPAQIDISTYGLLSFALVGLLLGSILLHYKRERKSSRASWYPYTSLQQRITKFEHRFGFSLEKASRYTFYSVLFAALLARAHAVFFVITNGYYAFFSEYFKLRASSPILFLLWKMELALPFAFAIVLGIWKKGTKFPTLVFLGYVLYLSLNIFSGQRFATVAGFLVVVIFLVRNFHKEIRKFIKNKPRFTTSLTLLILLAGIALLSAMERLRDTFDGTFSNIFLNFFYTQGVSLLTIKKTVFYLPLLPDAKYYSLSTFYYGIPAALMGLETYQGSSVQSALQGSSLSHTITYTTDPNLYFKGGGLGSSYIAEAFHDFGAVGVFLWSVLFGMLIAWIGFAKRSTAGEIIRYAIIPSILWTPRGEASAFIERLIQPSNLIVLIGVITFSFLYVWYVKPLIALVNSHRPVDSQEHCGE